jgi:hypothetical protein
MPESCLRWVCMCSQTGSDLRILLARLRACRAICVGESTDRPAFVPDVALTPYSHAAVTGRG